MRVILPEMIRMLKGWELCVLKAYSDNPHKGIWAVGYGHTNASGLPPVVDENTVLADEEAAHKILMNDLYQYYAPQLDTMLKADGIEVSDREWNALLDVLFNRGSGRLRKSKAWDWLKQTTVKNYRREACAALVYSQVDGFVPLNMAQDRITGEWVTKLGLTLRRIDDASLFQSKG